MTHSRCERVLTVLLGIACGWGLVACEVGEGRPGDETIRGVWEGGGKSDETATCTGACGGQAAAGCWCDDQCDAYGDCCPDLDAVCGGEAPTPAASGEPGASLGNFEFTYYWVTEEAAFGGADTSRLYDKSCNVLANVPAGFADAIKLEGTGRLTDGRVLNYWGSCDCPRSPCYFEVDDSHPWGHGVQNRALVPYRSVAVDKDVVAYGTSLYIEALDGMTMPGEAPWGGFVHDGCVTADDTGSAINGKHLDFFAARKVDYVAINGVLGASSVAVRKGGSRCDGSVDPADPGDPPAPPAGGGDANTLCFAGADNNGTACVPLVPATSVGSGYDYPGPLSGNANYREPLAYIDLEAVDADMKLAPNFKLSEVAQSWKGRYGVVQPHAIARLQALRDAAGAIKVNSGYRSPTYNSSVGGATHSRHMYGDAFDLDPLATSINTLEGVCTSNGGKLVEYSDHVHCDWRYDPVDTKLFGAAAMNGDAWPVAPNPFAASLERDGNRWSAPATGFDEGEPQRRWRAYDERGRLVGEAVGPTFEPPEGATELEVTVGAQVELATAL